MPIHSWLQQAVREALLQMRGEALPGAPAIPTIRALAEEVSGKLPIVDGVAKGLRIEAERNDDDSAVRLSQLRGGLRRPYFVFKNVNANVQTAPEPIKNPFAETLAYQPLKIDVIITVRPSLASTITISYIPPGGGASVLLYSRLINLGEASAANVIFDLIAPRASLPEVPVGAKLQVSATSGTFKIIIDGLMQ